VNLHHGPCVGGHEHGISFQFPAILVRDANIAVVDYQNRFAQLARLHWPRFASRMYPEPSRSSFCGLFKIAQSECQEETDPRPSGANRLRQRSWLILASSGLPSLPKWHSSRSTRASQKCKAGGPREPDGESQHREPRGRGRIPDSRRRDCHRRPGRSPRPSR